MIPIYQRQRGVLNLAYYHAMLLIHRPFLLSNFANLTGIRSHLSFRAPGAADTSANIASCLDAAMNIVRVVDDVFTSSNLFRAFWFTQYYAFCGVVVLYIYRIRQHLLSPAGQCEEYFAAGQKCQRQLESISETDCLARRYCVVLEELRLEAARQTNQQNRSEPGIAGTAPLPMAGTGAVDQSRNNSTVLAVPEMAEQNGASPDMTASFYNGNVPQTPDSAIFNSNYLPSNMADLTSWGQFDSLVTAGIGIFDVGFPGGDQNFGFGFNL